MSAVQSTTLPWMLLIRNMTKNLLKNVNPFDFFILLCAFLYGNIFAIQWSTLDWGFLLIFGVVFFIEIIDNFLYFFFNPNYKKYSRTLPFPKFFEFGAKWDFWVKISPYFLLNTVKRGFLLGFFLEAFKVGS